MLACEPLLQGAFLPCGWVNACYDMWSCGNFARWVLDMNSPPSGLPEASSNLMKSRGNNTKVYLVEFNFHCYC